MFVILRFIVACASLAGMAIYPSEQEMITRVGATILLFLYGVEDIVKATKMMIKGSKESGEIK